MLGGGNAGIAVTGPTRAAGMSVLPKGVWWVRRKRAGMNNNEGSLSDGFSTTCAVRAAH